GHEGDSHQDVPRSERSPRSRRPLGVGRCRRRRWRSCANGCSGRVAATPSRRIAMSVLIRFTPTSPTPTKLYDESIRRLEETGEFPPDGMELHCAFVVDGNVRVSEIWDSREQLDAFGERLMPL